MTNEFAGCMRNSSARATSSASPMRPSACIFSEASRALSLRTSDPVILEAICGDMQQQSLAARIALTACMGNQSTGARWATCRTTPGTQTLTRMLCGEYVLAADRAKPEIPPLAAASAYAAEGS